MVIYFPSVFSLELSCGWTTSTKQTKVNITASSNYKVILNPVPNVGKAYGRPLIITYHHILQIYGASKISGQKRHIFEYVL